MIRDVLVHLDGTAADAARLGVGTMVQAAHGSHLTGLYTNLLPTMVMVAELSGGAAAAMAEMSDQARLAGDQVAARLKAQLGALAMPAELRRIEGGLEGLVAMAVREARWHDLFVALRPLSTSREPIWQMLAEDVLLGGGRAVLLVPDDYRAPGSVERPFLCWDDSRAAARAMTEAMPFLQRAKSVAVGMVDADTGFDGEWRMPEADVARHLARQGVTAEIVPIAARGHAVADALQRAAAERGADLIVLGGFGHARAIEWAFGGVTRDMLKTAAVPLLMAH